MQPKKSHGGYKQHSPYLWSRFYITKTSSVSNDQMQFGAQLRQKQLPALNV